MVDIKQKPRLHASWIDPNAKEIVRILQREGFLSYLVGGCVRDLLVGIHPKDFDIATSAEPNQVKRKVWGSYVIGRRFRLVLVRRDEQQYEVATFRRETTPEEAHEAAEEAALDENSRPPLPNDNLFGTPEQDALRRDFTINALFYDPIKDELIDYANAMADIESRTLRMIGDPVLRIQEDPIRSLRAIRLSHKIGFQIEENLRAAIQSQAAEVAKSVLPRRREEYLKLLRLPDPVPAWLELYDLGILQHILPSLMPVLDDAERKDIFFSYLQRLDEMVFDLSKPIETLTPFVMAYLQAMKGHPDLDSLMEKLLKDELMMFKSEQAVVFGAMDLLEDLKNIEGFLRKGHRRQQAFLRNELFPLALRIAKAEHLLSPSAYHFWKQQIEQRQLSAPTPAPTKSP